MKEVKKKSREVENITCSLFQLYYGQSSFKKIKNNIVKININNEKFC